MKIKKNDTVLVLTGKDAGKTGKVLVAYPQDGKVTVDGINVQKKSKKARSANETSSIVEQCGPIDASNVEVICGACGKATKVGYKVVDDKKVRVCKKCGAVLDAAVKSVKEAKKEAAAKKPAAKKAAAKKTTAKKTTKVAEAVETAETAEVKDAE